MASSVLPKLCSCSECGEATAGSYPETECLEQVYYEDSRPVRGIFFGFLLSLGMWAGIGFLATHL